MRALIPIVLLTTGLVMAGTGEKSQLVSLGFGCVATDDDWLVTVTASGVDSFAGHIEPADGRWRVNWQTGLWEDLLQPTERNRVLSRTTELIQGNQWPVGLVERDGKRHWVAGDGFVQFSIAESTPDATGLLTRIAGRYRHRTADMKCKPPVQQK